MDIFEIPSISQSKIHLRIQQRNGRKCITIIEGLEDDLDLKRICRAMRNAFSCNGNVKDDIIQLQGDQRENIKEWLVIQEITTKDNIIVHGF